MKLENGISLTVFSSDLFLLNVSQFSAKDYLILEQSSTECVKPKPPTVTDMIDLTNPMNQSELEANAGNCSRRTRENACEQAMIGFGFTSHWPRKWCLVEKVA